MPSNCGYFCSCFHCQKREVQVWLPGTGYLASWCRNHCSHSRCGCVDHWYHLQMQGYLAARGTKPVPRGKNESKFTNHTMAEDYLWMCNERDKQVTSLWLNAQLPVQLWSHSPWQLLDVHPSSGLTDCCCRHHPPAHVAKHTPGCHCLHWPSISRLGTTAAHRPPASDQWVCRCDDLPPSHHDGECVPILSHWEGDTFHFESKERWSFYFKLEMEETTVPGKYMIIPA